VRRRDLFGLILLVIASWIALGVCIAGVWALILLVGWGAAIMGVGAFMVLGAVVLSLLGSEPERGGYPAGDTLVSELPNPPGVRVVRGVHDWATWGEL